MIRTSSRHSAYRRLVAGLILALFSCLVLLASAPPAAAAPPSGEAEVSVQAQASYFIRGTLRDEEREPLEGVTIRATGDGGSGEGTSDADGRWEIGLPTGGAYTVELDESTLPDGVSLAPGQENPREVAFEATTNLGVIFAFGEGAAPAPSGSADASAAPAASDAPVSGENVGTAEETGRSFWVVLGERTLAGLTFGLILGLAAVGLSLVYGTTGLNNFAHGETVTLGAVLAYFLAAVGLPFWLAAVLAVMIGGAYGYLNDSVIWKPLRDRRAGLVPMMIVSIGFALTMRYIIQFFFGGSTRQLPGAQSAVLNFGPFSITSNNLISMVVSLAIIVAVAFLLMRSRLGKATRAVADNPALAAASGIDVDRVIRLVWVIGAALAALAGILYAFYRPGVTFNMGQQILLMLFAAVTLGGLGTIFGALVGSLFVGLLTELSTIWLAADLKYVGPLLLMIVVLIFRPQGLLGKKDRIG